MNPAEIPAPETASRPATLFQRADWCSFAVTWAVALGVYLYTLIPHIDLNYSGQLSVAAKYAGVPNPPAYPVWVLGSWMFLKLLPEGNVAGQLALESALCASLAGALVALMVSAGGRRLLEGLKDFRRLPSKDEKILCASAGMAAGMGFCLDGGVWSEAVVADVWGSTYVLWASSLCLFMRWAFTPERLRYLCAGIFLYTLAVVDSQTMLAAALGLQLLVVLWRPTLGRDLLLVNLMAGLASLAAWHWEFDFPLNSYLFFGSRTQPLFLFVLVASLLTVIGLVIRTRRVFTEWRGVLLAVLTVSAGLAFCLYPALASHSNPPMNWAYPRTVEGFHHSLTRGQFDSAFPVQNPHQLGAGLGGAVTQAKNYLGWYYLLAAAAVLLFVHRLDRKSGRWIASLWLLLALTTLLLVWELNPRGGYESWILGNSFFDPLHLLISLIAGAGLVFFGTILARGKPRPEPPPGSA